MPKYRKAQISIYLFTDKGFAPAPVKRHPQFSSARQASLCADRVIPLRFPLHRSLRCRHCGDSRTPIWSEQGLPEEFLDEEVTIMMNTHSGNVFLTNADFQVAVMNGDNLEIFYTDFETGEEGFKEDLSEDST